MVDAVRAAVIGIGNMGSAHAVGIYDGKVNGMKLTSVCDVDEGKCKWARNRFPGVSIFQNSGDLLESGAVDAIIIATPHYSHPDIAVEAFDKGMHVLTEKPVGVYTKQAEEMNAAAIRSGKVFGIMFNQRTNPLFLKARELVQSGELGEPKRLVWIVTNWYRTQAYYDSGDWRATWSGEGGGVLMNQAPHNLDLWQWIFGMPTRIRAFCGYGKYHKIEAEDDATVYAEYKNGATAAFITSTGEYPGTNRLEICGTRGKIVAEDGCLKYWKLKTDERDICFLSHPSEEMFEVKYAEILPERAEAAHIGILQNFTDAILTGAELLAPGVEGIRELTLSNAAYLSHWKDGWVSLPIDAEEYLRYLDCLRSPTGASKESTAAQIPAGQYENRWKVRW